MKTFKTCTYIILCTLALVSCKKEESFNLPEMTEQEKTHAQTIEGAWTEFTPFNELKPKSFILDANGEAKSTNMINNEYKKWWVSNNNLCILSQTIDSKNDTLVFGLKALSNDVMVLEQNNSEYTYKKETIK
ncbi:hypothetical protein HX017_06465 [Myroides marinus]|uniref:Lipocalin-like domain-containing protein n=1 Tax=Myroides marinus TaxID=703342 RepID=A0A163ZLI4_9FLAO|nr:lipocalin family protein [Myroides marinus]KZE82023.1 hypothetical protein AV926_07795 [Myroides marinus]MDM1364594.1 hypothetical protein [Myroides marinus]